MSKVAIITARGGSKRIPRKNIKNFLDKPIIAYSIEAALKSKLFDEVMVSTDDKEIADIGKTYGASVPFFRSQKNSDDYSTTVEVLEEVLNEYKNIGKDFDYGCCIYPTAPFITEKLLIESFQILEKDNRDIVFPVVNFGFPIQRAVKIIDDGRIKMFQPEHMMSRSQDLEKAYHDAGQFYWFNSAKLLINKKLWTDNTGVIILPEMQAQDIDTKEDWEIAEFKYKLNLNNV